MKGRVRRERFTVTITRTQRQLIETPTATGGVTQTWQRVVVGKEDHQVEVEADMDALEQGLGRKALASKGGRAIEAGGLIDVRRIPGLPRVWIHVDMKRLALSLGPKAVRSKGGRAVEAGGAVVVRRVKS